MQNKTHVTGIHTLRLRLGYLIITQDANPGGADEPSTPAQTVWLDPRDVRELIAFLKDFEPTGSKE